MGQVGNTDTSNEGTTYLRAGYALFIHIQLK